VANGRLLREGPFDDIWIQPAAGDAGGALERRSLPGTSCSRIRAHGGQSRPAEGSYLGPRFEPTEVQKFLDGIGAKYHRATGENDLIDRVVNLLEQENRRVVPGADGLGPAPLSAQHHR
jgi:carbamoyltransferase